jgi:hypothetical protein
MEGIHIYDKKKDIFLIPDFINYSGTFKKNLIWVLTLQAN